MSIAANASLVTAVTAKTSNNGTSRTNTSLFNTSATDDDLIELTLKEECDLSRVNALMKKDVADLVENSSTTSPLPTLENDDDIDKILSDELEKLTFDEREQIAFDVHGLSHHRQEDPTDVDTKLAELEHEIRKIRNRKDYEKAKYLNNDFVSHRGFRLLFLRCDEFDTQVAAQRIVKHFEIKREMFGDKCLARELRMSDLNEADMVALRSGIFHVLPTRDVAGRTVVVFDQSLRPEVPLSNRVRATWYFFEVLSRDESCQHKGFVVIALGIGKSYQRINFAGITKFARVRSGVPRRVACFHCCSDNPSFRPIVASLRLISRRDTRHRFISHFGEQESVLFQLQTYGIPTDDLFAGQDGQVNLDWHHKWLNIVRAREEHRSGPTDDIIIPLRFDVLFGRGKNTREHTGNLRALHLCEMVRPQYEAASKFEKTAIAERIVHAIRDSHGRFLKWEEDGWVEVETETAREKISHFFRHYRTKQTSFQDQVRSSTKTKRRKSPELNASVSDKMEITRRESKQPYRPYSKGHSNTDFVAMSGNSEISTEGDFFFSSE